jgi:hypothetical protein
LISQIVGVQIIFPFHGWEKYSTDEEMDDSMPTTDRWHGFRGKEERLLDLGLKIS